MLSNTNQKTVDHSPQQPVAAIYSSLRQLVSIDEFSLPPYFFDKDFLDNGDVREPYVKERMQLERSVA